MRNIPSRVIFITGQLGLGGAERQLFLLASALQRIGVPTSVVSFNGGKGDHWEHVLPTTGARVVTTDAAAGHLTRVRSLLSEVRRSNARIVHSWSVHTNFYAALAGRVCSASAIGSDRSSHLASRRDLGLPKYWLSTAGLDALVVNSAAAGQAVRDLAPWCKRVVIIPNAVELHAPQSTMEVAETRRALGVPLDAFAIAGVGALRRQKRWDVLIDAVAQVAAHGANVCCCVVGDGPERRALTDRAAAAGVRDRVRILGARPGIARELNAFDAVCLPSESEGMPNVLMEAAAAGVPVVACATGGIPEIVCDGTSGIIAERTGAAMGDALMGLLQDPGLRARMGKAGRLRMQREFSETCLLERAIRAYENASGRPYQDWLCGSAALRA